MKVSPVFLKDFAYIANLYGWDAADIDDAKAQTRAAPGPMVAYWTMLAGAHRAGYRQDLANGYMRLGAWAAQRRSESHGAKVALDVQAGQTLSDSHDYRQSSDSCMGRRGGANE